jgi:flagellar FliL protein
MSALKERKLATTTAAAPAAGGAGGPDAATPRRGKGKRLLVVLAAVMLAAGLGAGGFWWFAVRTPPPPPPPEPGEVVALDPISLNLADGRYLKVGIALQWVYSGEKGKTHDGSKALDLAIDTFSGRSVEELSDPARRDALKEDLLVLVEEAYEGEVLDLYLTEFVMQ